MKLVWKLLSLSKEFRKIDSSQIPEKLLHLKSETG